MVFKCFQEAFVSPIMLKTIWKSITAMGRRQCLPLSVVQLKGKHCRRPITVMGVAGVSSLSVLGVLADQLVNPISTTGDRLCPPNYILLAPPDFQTFRRPWVAHAFQVWLPECCPILKGSHYEPHHQNGSYKCLLATFLDSGYSA